MCNHKKPQKTTKNHKNHKKPQNFFCAVFAK
jgi:hypothetical protein